MNAMCFYANVCINCWFIMFHTKSGVIVNKFYVYRIANKTQFCNWMRNNNKITETS